MNLLRICCWNVSGLTLHKLWKLLYVQDSLWRIIRCIKWAAREGLLLMCFNNLVFSYITCHDQALKKDNIMLAWSKIVLPFWLGEVLQKKLLTCKYSVLFFKPTWLNADESLISEALETKIVLVIIHLNTRGTMQFDSIGSCCDGLVFWVSAPFSSSSKGKCILFYCFWNKLSYLSESQVFGACKGFDKLVLNNGNCN